MVELNLEHGGALGLLWVDLETTGTDERLDDIIEIGAVVTDFNFERFDFRATRDFSHVIEPTALGLGRLIKNPVVRQMHENNGLLDDCLNHPERSRLIRQAEELMYRYITLAINSQKPRGQANKFQFMLAGSGVGHFDRRFINRHMPRIANLLTYAPLDVGMVRRFLKMSGVDLSGADNTSAKNHRAYDDILLHLEEARTYRDLFNQKFNDPVVFNATAAPVDPDFVLDEDVRVEQEQ